MKICNLCTPPLGHGPFNQNPNAKLRLGRSKLGILTGGWPRLDGPAAASSHGGVGAAPSAGQRGYAGAWEWVGPPEHTTDCRERGLA